MLAKKFSTFRLYRGIYLEIGGHKKRSSS